MSVSYLRRPPDYEERLRMQRETIAAEEAAERKAEAAAKKQSAVAKAMAAYTRPERRAALVRHHAAKRRLEKINRTPAWSNQSAIKAFYVEALRLTKDTGVMHHVDHIIPLQGALVSGLHVETNLQVLPWRENVVKHNHFELEA